MVHNWLDDGDSFFIESPGGFYRVVVEKRTRRPLKERSPPFVYFGNDGVSYWLAVDATRAAEVPFLIPENIETWLASLGDDIEEMLAP